MLCEENVWSNKITATIREFISKEVIVMFTYPILLFVVAVVAFALSAICGGGASVLLLPVLNLILPGAQVPAALSIGTAASSVSRMVIFYRNIRWDIVVWFVPPALPAVYFGAKLLSIIDPVLLELVIGIFLVINLPFIFRTTNKSAVLPQRAKWVLSLIGLATGFLSGLTGAVGLLFNRFYLTYSMTKEQIIATRAANELLLHILKIVLYGIFGLLSSKAVSTGIVISIAAIASAQLIKYFIKLITVQSYQKIGFIAMVASGMTMLVNSGFTLYKDQSIQFSLQKVDDKFDTKIKWKQTMLSMEFAFDQGLEIERVIEFRELPLHYQKRVTELNKNADHMVLEEVYKYKDNYYELYLYKDAKLTKYKLR